MTEIKDLLSKEAQDVLNRSRRKQMLLDAEAEDRLRMKTQIALTKMQRAKEKAEADLKQKEKKLSEVIKKELNELVETIKHNQEKK